VKRGFEHWFQTGSCGGDHRSRGKKGKWDLGPAEKERVMKTVANRGERKGGKLCGVVILATDQCERPEIWVLKVIRRREGEKKKKKKKHPFLILGLVKRDMPELSELYQCRAYSTEEVSTKGKHRQKGGRDARAWRKWRTHTGAKPSEWGGINSGGF